MFITSKEDFIETMKLTDRMISDFKLFPITLVNKPENENDIFTSTMFSFEMKRDFRDDCKNLINNARGYIFVHSDINLNGITDKNDNGRFYVIHFKVICSFRRYRCKNWYENHGISSIYSYGRNIEDAFKMFYSDFEMMKKTYIKQNILK